VATFRLAPIAILFAAAASAQSVEIYSEFHRLDPFGAVVAADKALAVREILSPAVARNGFASFHIAVSVPPKESYLLYVVTNPVNACRVALYKEHFVATLAGWIPDPLVEIERLPDFGVMPDPDEKIEGQNTRLYLLDLWIPPDADVARFRVEVQLKVGIWTVVPMEVRVLEARIPEIVRGPDVARFPTLPPVEGAADASAMQVLADYFTGTRPQLFGRPATLREIIRRNAEQDVALAGSLDPRVGGADALMRRFLGLCFAPRILGAETYLRIRDFLYSQ
jgi:hypothetical protein